MTQNISTFRASKNDIKRLDSALAQLGLASRSHFFRQVALRFIEQVEAHQTPDWPPKYVVRPDIQKRAPDRPKRT
jgi:hypothetical protein